MATTQATSQLNLGHLIHQADNHRGSFRGRGFELRTDAFGAVRGRRGVLLSTYPLPAAAPAGHAEAAVALAEQHRSLNAVFSEAAKTHATPALGSAVGVRNAQRSQLNADAAPLAAHVRSLSGRVPGDDFGASGQATGDDSADHVPHSGDALLTLAGCGGIAISAAQGLHVAADETVSLGSGQDLEIAVAQQMRLHSEQAIGWLAGSQQGKPGGLEFIASQGAVDVQAQHDVLALRSRDDLTLASINADLSVTAKQSVHLAVSGGAYLTIEDGRITFSCPGKITVHAAQHRLEGPIRHDAPLPLQPNASLFQPAYSQTPAFTDTPDAWLPQTFDPMIQVRTGAESLATLARARESTLASGVTTTQAQTINLWHGSGSRWAIDETIDVADDDATQGSTDLENEENLDE